MDFKKIMTAFAPIVTLIVVTGVYAVAIGSLLTAGDSTAAWLLDRATEGDANLEILAAPVGEMGQNIGVFLIVSLLTFFGAIMNFLLMIFRDVIILVLLAFLPVVAASTGSVSGKQAFQKINGWLIALLLFKPVAAGIYALGLRMMTQDSEIEGLGGELQNYASAMTGMLISALAGLALPALIKFVAPAAAMGAAAFGGGAAVAGAATVAAGAAVVAGTGGAAAPAVAGGAQPCRCRWWRCSGRRWRWRCGRCWRRCRIWWRGRGCRWRFLRRCWWSGRRRGARLMPRLVALVKVPPVRLLVGRLAVLTLAPMVTLAPRVRVPANPVAVTLLGR